MFVSYQAIAGALVIYLMFANKSFIYMFDCSVQTNCDLTYLPPHGLRPVESASLNGHSWQDRSECRPQRLFKALDRLTDFVRLCCYARETS